LRHLAADQAQIQAAGTGFVADANDVSGNNIPLGGGSYVGDATTVAGATSVPGVAQGTIPVAGTAAGTPGPVAQGGGAGASSGQAGDGGQPAGGGQAAGGHAHKVLRDKAGKALAATAMADRAIPVTAAAAIPANMAITARRFRASRNLPRTSKAHSASPIVATIISR
jgi:hypothetical protein